MSVKNDDTTCNPSVMRLLAEKRELRYRMTELNRFNHSNEFLELTDEEQALLLEQHRTMQRYYGILEKRCESYT